MSSKDNKELPLTEHLSELVYRLRVILFSLILLSLVISLLPANLLNPLFFDDKEEEYKPLVLLFMYKVKEDALNFNEEPMATLAKVIGLNESIKRNIKLISPGIFDSLLTSFYMGILLGLLAASPIIGYEIYKFVEPALYPQERKLLCAFTAGFTILFLLGSLYAYKYIVPLTMLITIWITLLTGALPVFSINSFYYTLFLVILVTGISFTFPIVIALLVKVELLTPSSLKNKWKYVILAILVITAFITPDPTPLTMLLLSLPFLALYILSLILSKIIYNRKHASKALAR